MQAYNTIISGSNLIASIDEHVLPPAILYRLCKCIQVTDMHLFGVSAAVWYPVVR